MFYEIKKEPERTKLHASFTKEAHKTHGTHRVPVLNLLFHSDVVIATSDDKTLRDNESIKWRHDLLSRFESATNGCELGHIASISISYKAIAAGRGGGGWRLRQTMN